LITPATLIDPSYSDSVNKNVYSCYNAGSKKNIFSWAHGFTPYYSNGGGIGSTQIITLSDAAYDVFCCYNPSIQNSVFSWFNQTSPFTPYYSIEGSETAQPIDSTYSNVINVSVYSCYDPSVSNNVFSWKDSSNAPYYAVGEGVGVAQLIASVTDVASNVFCCYDSNLQKVVFSWLNTSFTPYYSIEGSGTAQPIDPSYNTGTSNVYCCYDSSLQKVVFSWADNSSGFNTFPYYAVLGGIATKIDPSYANASINGSVYCCYANSLQKLVFSWADISGAPYYALGEGEGVAQPIDPNYNAGIVLNGDVACSYDHVNQMVVFTWSSVSQNPYYAIYSTRSNNAYQLLFKAATKSKFHPQKGLL
jgi:hypothetical protein